MRILSSADWHINLHRKKVPYLWQTERFKMLFDKLLDIEKTCDVHIIAGDVFDKHPETDEICLLLSYLNCVTIPTIIIPGNHEATSKGRSFLEHFNIDNALNNPLVKISTENERVNIKGQWFSLFPYGSVQTNKLPEYYENDILVTHIRGDVPPHISAEFDLDKLLPWKLILLGDLHFNHKHDPYPMYYPGSPLNTSFDRDEKRTYGVDIIDFISVDNYSIQFIDLQLPKLIRKSITVGQELISGTYDHVIYEVVGSIDEISKLEGNVLLDRKIVQKKASSSILNLKDKTILEELELYLQYLKVSDKEPIITEFKKLGIQ